MKKILITLLLSATSLFFIGCSNNDENHTDNQPQNIITNTSKPSSNASQLDSDIEEEEIKYSHNSQNTQEHDNNEETLNNEDANVNDESVSKDDTSIGNLENETIEYSDDTLPQNLVRSIFKAETKGVLDLDNLNINIKNFTYANNSTIPHKYDSVFIPLNINTSLLEDTDDILKISLYGKTKDGSINYLPLNNLGNIHIDPEYYKQGETDYHIVKLNSDTPQNIILGYDVDLSNYVSFTATIKNAYGGELYESTTFREHMNEQ